eukprot:TRINITY_DN15304_c0_g1_i1.p1 TRINITY_DN15304_c0_g1~~TRINITY_DN15304_c0_g1_i1.p1  ORF type:complete len:576 (-),score=163.85 TRINITY_DN15304_c0_g1_i1:413-2140(-)
MSEKISASERLHHLLAEKPSVSQFERLCGLFGWGREIIYEAEGGWLAAVTCGPTEAYRIETGEHHPRTKKGEKAGRAAAAAKAVEELKGRAASILKQEVQGLEAIFKEPFPSDILESSKTAWARFWKLERRAVSIGTQGNDGSALPVLVQVAAPGLVILELSRCGGKFSTDLMRLLNDASITKVFCDSAAQRDMKSLGLGKDSQGVEDLEVLAARRFGKAPGLRGLARIASLILGNRIERGGSDVCEEFEKGSKARSLSDFSKKAIRYAAMEAFATLQTWEALKKVPPKDKVQVQVSQKRSAPVQQSSDERKSKKRLKKAISEDEDAVGLELDAEIRALEDELERLDEKEHTKDTTAKSKKKSKDSAKSKPVSPELQETKKPVDKKPLKTKETKTELKQALPGNSEPPIKSKGDLASKTDKDKLGSTKAKTTTATATTATTATTAAATQQKTAAATTAATQQKAAATQQKASDASDAKKNPKLATEPKADTSRTSKKTSRPRWLGWKKALDDQLQSAGGEMPWQKLQKAVVHHRRNCRKPLPKSATEEELRLRALSAIPEVYLSGEDGIVRMPSR